MATLLDPRELVQQAWRLSGCRPVADVARFAELAHSTISRLLTSDAPNPRLSIALQFFQGCCVYLKLDGRVVRSPATALRVIDQRLREQRTTLKRVAEQAGRCPRNLSRQLNRKRPDPRLATLCELLEQLGVSCSLEVDPEQATVRLRSS